MWTSHKNSNLRIVTISPSGVPDEEKLEAAYQKAQELKINILQSSGVRLGIPSFLNGSQKDRLKELIEAENIDCDAIWCTRGGCGAITLWYDYQKEHYQNNAMPLIGYSDITILHFLRFYQANRIGIHGPVFTDIVSDKSTTYEALDILIRNEAQKIVYPALKPINRFLNKNISGQLIPMNLISLESIVGGFPSEFFQGKILCLEDVNEPHYKIFRALYHLKNVGLLAGIKALLIGHLGFEREKIITETILPLALELGFPLFDWPVFGHEEPNWPLLFGARATIRAVDENYYCLRYDEQHNHTIINHET